MIPENSPFSSHSYTESQMQNFAEELAFRVKNFPEGGQVLFLNGEVGAGKTTFTRFFSQALGANSASSPTFSLIEKREISEKITVFHGDFYRGDDARIEEIMDEYQEMQEKESQKFPEKTYIWILEWFPEHLIEEFFPNIPFLQLDFQHGETPENREISLSFFNPLSVSKKDVENFLEKYKTPVHIRKHIEMVRKIALTVAKKLQKNRIPLDIDLVENAALLHDAVKYVDFTEYTKKEKSRYNEEITQEKLQVWKSIRQKFLKIDHGKAMAEILITFPHFFPATARLIKSHMTRRVFSDEPMTWEEKVLYYADKRALHDSFVTLRERLHDGQKRYAHEASPDLENRIFDLEKLLEISGNFSGKDLEISE